MAWLIDALGLTGFALVLAGLYQIYPPAAYLFGGAALLMVCVLLAKPRRNQR